MEHKFKLVVGDWSSDGHGISDTTVCICNHSNGEVMDAHKKLASKGINLLSQCNRYDDSKLGKDFIEKLNGIGFNLSEIDFDDLVLGEGEVYINGDDWVKLYMELVKIEIPDLQYKFINDGLPSIYIGGYGLYSN
jgi:hypothetical protein